MEGCPISLTNKCKLKQKKDSIFSCQIGNSLIVYSLGRAVRKKALSHTGSGCTHCHNFLGRKFDSIHKN